MPTKALSKIQEWFAQKQWNPFPFQEECWQAYLNGESGLLNAPTGSGKTLALWLPCLMEYMSQNPKYNQPKKNGLQILWITPLRALTKDTQRAMEEACTELNVAWRVGMRTGDTASNERQKQKRNMPECLITTPESLHLMLAQKQYPNLFKNLKAVIVDEWHELIGSKRGVQVELGLSRLFSLQPQLKVWGISATIGNLAQAAEVLIPKATHKIIRAKVQKRIEVTSILPDVVEKFPWAGHLGIHLLDKILPIVNESQTTLLFTNTRAMTEIWYQKILELAPELAGTIAMHHSSLEREVRDWVEEAIHKGKLKLVVCTSSLDLGVDFRPVETVIQVGSPKGVARFLQRAGRSGHRPDALSKIYFLPTHSLELIEGAALRQAVLESSKPNSESVEVKHIESRLPIRKSLDVLVQYLVTLAVSDGFFASEIFQEIKQTYAFRDLTEDEWNWCLMFITTGGETLDAYQEFNKVERDGDFFAVTSKKTAMRHRFSIGTIVSEPIIKVKYASGGYIGSVEEYFVSRLNSGDTFFFAGRNLEFVRLKEDIAQVKNSKKKKGQVPRWSGARMQLSSQLSDLILEKIDQHQHSKDIEMQTIQPIFDLQNRWSHIPQKGELLIEQIRTEEGHHLFFYPFEGRLVHEIMAALFAFRISQMQPITFSIAMNDYGFELLADTEIPFEHAMEMDLFTTKDLVSDIERSLNNSEMARRRFREIAAISGLVFQGYPNKYIKSRHLQASTQLLFDVFVEYDPNNLLIKQAYDEVLNVQLEQDRLVKALEKMQRQKLVIQNPHKPTPFAFPILVDRLRDTISSESLVDRITNMQLQLERYVEEG